MKLELKHLAPYLPYGLKIKMEQGKHSTIREVLPSDISHYIYLSEGTTAKPILRPLADLIKKKEQVKNGKFIFKDKLIEHAPFNNFFLDFDDIEKGKLNQRPAWVVASLIEYHYDVFGLIPKGLAIDINTLNKTYENTNKN